MNPTPPSLLLIAHGSRRPEANDDLRALAAIVADKPDIGRVQVSYLELAEPTIAEGARLLVEGGAGDVVMVPYFLSPGVHVREDLTEALAELSAAYPGTRFTLGEHLGRHPLLARIVEERVAEALAKHGANADGPAP